MDNEYEIPESVKKYFSVGNLSKQTIRQYNRAYNYFSVWCLENNLDYKNPETTTIARYLASVACDKSTSTLNLYWAGIQYVLKERGFNVNSSDSLIKETIRGIRKINHKEPKGASPLMLDDIKKIAKTCDDTNLGLRDRAMILVGFAGAFRRSELVAIDVEHIKWTQEGIIIFVPRSKGDQTGVGAIVNISNGTNEDTCAPSAVRAWLTRANIESGPVFVNMSKTGRILGNRMSDKYVWRTIKSRANQAGVLAIGDQEISAHSLRVGLITEAYKAGVSDLEIMDHSRHKTFHGMQTYVRREKLKTKFLGTKIGM